MNVKIPVSHRLPVKALIAWYAANGRDLPWRRSRAIYRIWISEVMLQQTRSDTVVPFYRRFLKRFPSLPALAKADFQEVLKSWEGLGYYSRARNLHLAARAVISEYGGVIPTTEADFGRLAGVGPYITAAVLSIACGQPLPAVDGNVLRVFSRFFGSGRDIGRTATRKWIRRRLQDVIPENQPGDFNQALMELGARICLPRRPQCPVCPLRRRCVARVAGWTGKLPHRRRRKPVPLYHVALAVLVRGGRFFIQRRSPSGHLAGMWEFPGGKARRGEAMEQALRRELREELGIEVVVLDQLAAVRHAYSHFAVRLHVFVCRPGSGRMHCLRPHRWIGLDEISAYPFPAANHKIFAILRQDSAFDKGGRLCYT